MPLDAYHLYAVTRELSQRLENGRIDKITMPAPSDVLLHIRAQGENVRLMISANPAKPRLWLTKLDYVNPMTAPAYCMHLRKYLLGGKIISVSSSPYERVVKMEILAHSEIGDERTMTLVVEIMGRYSNVLLLDNGRITDCLKHTPFGTDAAHPALPNLNYAPNIQADKFYADDEERLAEHLRLYHGGDLSAYLLNALAGFAGFTLKIILKNVTLSVPPTDVEIQQALNALKNAYAQLQNGNYVPCVVIKEGRAMDFSILPPNSDHRIVSSILDAETAYYSDIDATALWSASTSAPMSAVNAELKKLEKRIALLEDKIQESVDSDKLRIFGEILTANLYQIPAHEKVYIGDNWTDGSTVSIPLDPTKTPIQNANAYYKKYNKLKRAATIAATLISESRERKDYLESIKASFVTCATYDDVEGIKRELESAGLIRKVKTKTKQPPIKNKPILVMCDGYEILVGKNNLQNEELTFKIAKNSDVWLHVLHAHGSHVLIKHAEGTPLPDTVLLRAAELAAYYSTARNSDKVEVDYAFKKHVTRNAGKGLGNVTYTHQKSLMVHPTA